MLLQLLLSGACAVPGTPSSSMPVVVSAPTPAGVEVVWLGHGHFDHIVDAPALAQIYNVPLRVPGDLANTAMTLGVLPANLLLRMD